MALQAETGAVAFAADLTTDADIDALTQFLAGSGAIQRILTASPTPFTYFHTVVDLIVIGLSATALAISFRKEPEAGG